MFEKLSILPQFDSRPPGARPSGQLCCSRAFPRAQSNKRLRQSRATLVESAMQTADSSAHPCAVGGFTNLPFGQCNDE